MRAAALSPPTAGLGTRGLPACARGGLSLGAWAPGLREQKPPSTSLLSPAPVLPASLRPPAGRLPAPSRDPTSD